MVVIWDASCGQALQRLAVRAVDGPRAIRVLGEMQLAAGISAHEGDPAVIWHLSSDSPRHELRQSRGPVSVLEASPCATKLVTMGKHDGSSTLSVWDAYLWDVATGQLEWEFRTPRLACCAVAVSRGGGRIVVVSREGVSEVLV